jgi:hypothetical protein
MDRKILDIFLSGKKINKKIALTVTGVGEPSNLQHAVTYAKAFMEN